MFIELDDYISSETFKRIQTFSEDKETPFLVVDSATVEKNLDDLKNGFPYANIYYAVKANPAVEVLTLMRDKGINFDIASVYELDRVLSLGISPDRVSYGNTIKKSRDVRYFYDKGSGSMPRIPKPTSVISPKPHRAPKSMSGFYPKAPLRQTGPCPENSAASRTWPWI